MPGFASFFRCPCNPAFRMLALLMEGCQARVPLGFAPAAEPISFMNIPADAVIATDKLTGYLLIARPLDDKSKFLASAGFTQSNFEILEAAIRNLATVAPAEEDGRNDYGIFWRVAGRLQGPTGTLQVVTVWLQWHLDGRFRFITLKPLRK